jgi:hypothetical protein
MAPSFSHSGTESTGAQGVDGLNVIVEVKAARALDPVFERQLLICLKIMNLRLGLLMNFGMATMKAASVALPIERVTPCGPVPYVPLCANDAHAMHSLSYNCHRICESDYLVSTNSAQRTRNRWWVGELVKMPS